MQSIVCQILNVVYLSLSPLNCRWGLLFFACCLFFKVLKRAAPFCLRHKRSNTKRSYLMSTLKNKQKRITSSQTEGFFAARLLRWALAWPLPTKSGKTWAWFLSRPGRSRPVLSENPEALQPHLASIVLPDFLPKLSVWRKEKPNTSIGRNYSWQ